jgi:hypothetical protein
MKVMSALATHRSGDTGGVYGLQARSVKGAFGACVLIRRPKGRGMSRFSVAGLKAANLLGASVITTREAMPIQIGAAVIPAASRRYLR